MRLFKTLKTSIRYSFASVDMNALKKLRDITGAPLNKCKEALESNSDFEKAKEFLKQKNLIFFYFSNIYFR